MDFRRGQDPVKSLGLGYGNKMNTKAWKILQFIGSKGEEGAGLTDIQRFLWTELQERSLKDFEMSSNDKWGYNYPSLYNKTRATRGYYNTNLYGTRYKPGLLRKYCRKMRGENGFSKGCPSLVKIYMKTRDLNLSRNL